MEVGRSVCMNFIWESPFRLQIVVKSIEKNPGISGFYR